MNNKNVIENLGEKFFKSTNSLNDNIIESIIVDIMLDCLRNIKSTLVVLKNSFFIITNKELVVLKYFICKNSDINMEKYVPNIGENLKDESYGKTSLLYANIRKTTSQVRINEKINKTTNTIDSIAIPIKYKKDIVAYISLNIFNNNCSNILNIFIESLALNIENAIEKYFFKEYVNRYMNLFHKNSNENFYEVLSFQERLITKYMLLTYSNNEIANKLSISESTVKTYFRRIYEKCGTSNRFDTTITLICYHMLQML